MLGYQAKLSTTQHPQTDGQTEVVDGTLEDYLRAFTRDIQDRWDRLLTMVEFAMNSIANVPIGEMLFQYSYCRHPIVLNIQKFGAKLAQVDTPREKYAHIVIYSSMHQIPRVIKYVAYLRRTSAPECVSYRTEALGTSTEFTQVGRAFQD